ncbi:hypothetical protein B0J17DRAFT_640236 [Rhizoctonia solani]|nr:hypothetical protein B0J17DRAFT_640236 [Rhizoctonia solani]
MLRWKPMGDPAILLIAEFSCYCLGLFERALIASECMHLSTMRFAWVKTTTRCINQSKGNFYLGLAMALADESEEDHQVHHPVSSARQDRSIPPSVCPAGSSNFSEANNQS